MLTGIKDVLSQNVSDCANLEVRVTQGYIEICRLDIDRSKSECQKVDGVRFEDNAKVVEFLSNESTTGVLIRSFGLLQYVRLNKDEQGHHQFVRLLALGDELYPVKILHANDKSQLVSPHIVKTISSKGKSSTLTLIDNSGKISRYRLVKE